MRTLLTRGRRALLATMAALMIVGMLPGVAQALTPNTTIAIGPCDTIGSSGFGPSGCPGSLADPVAYTTAAFEFFATNGSGVFPTCDLDGAPCVLVAANSSTPATRFKAVWFGLGEGMHTLTVGTVGDPTPEEWTFEIDLTAPGDAAITGAPPVLSNSSTATFVVAPPVPATEPVRLMCRLDDIKDPTAPAPYKDWDLGAFDYQNRRDTGEVQSLTFTSGSAGDTYTLSVWQTGVPAPLGTSTPGTIPAGGFASLTAAQVEATLETIPALGGVSVSAAGGATFLIEFTGLPGLALDPVVVSGTAGGFASDVLPATLPGGGTAKAWEYDDDTYVACNSPKTFTNLADGPHTMSVVAEDGAGNGGAVDFYQWRVDTVKPVTTITGSPTLIMGSGDASFSFSASETEVTFECEIDTDGYAPCTTPIDYLALGDSSHVFKVRATDEAGNVGNPDIYSWSVDTTEPDTTIVSGPAGPTNIDPPVFGFSSDDPNATFECQMDGGGFAACDNPAEFAGLAQGPHTLDVRAIDPFARIDSSPATRAFSLDTVAPDTSIDTGPAALIVVSDATFTFSSPEVGATFECRLDASVWEACTSPQQYTGLSNAAHTLDVRAKDAPGNVDPTPATWAWTVNAPVPPNTSLLTGPSGTVASSTATFTFSSDQAPVTFECKLDAAAYAPCTSPAIYPGLSNGSHTFLVRATNTTTLQVDATPASRNWTVNVPGPNTSILTGPSGTVGVPDATFTFSSDQSPVTFECKLDGAAYAPCTSPITYLGLADAEHTFLVRATNTTTLQVDGSPASRTWTIDVPNYRPDARVALMSGPFVGDDVYSDEVFHDATGQVRQGNIRAGRSATYVFRLENDGVDPDRFLLKGCSPQGGPAGFTPKWTTSGNTVTNGVSAGTHMTGVIAPGGSVDYRLVVATTTAAKNNFECNLRIDSNNEATLYDINQARTHIR